MLKSSELRYQAEEVARNSRDLYTFDSKAMTTEQIDVMIHELRVHQIELEMQNEELRCSQMETEISREKYFELYDLAPVGYITISENGIIHDANLTAATLLGATRGDLVNHPITQFFLAEDKDIYYQYRRNLIVKNVEHSESLTGSVQDDTAIQKRSQAEKGRVCELRMVKKNKTIFWVQLESVVTSNVGCGLLCRIVITDISERKHAEEIINKLLAEKELILKEVHHRIKNNMSTISAFLSLQANISDNKVISQALNDADNRVRSMMVLYDKLYQSSNYSELSVKEYLIDMTRQIVKNFSNSSSVAIIHDIEDIVLDVAKMQPLGVIINELLTNIMKYAFINRADGLITVSIKLITSELNHDFVRVVIQDNGNGIPDTVDFDNSTGFGLTLVKLLTDQLCGVIRIERSDGTKIILEFDI